MRTQINSDNRSRLKFSDALNSVDKHLILSLHFVYLRSLKASQFRARQIFTLIAERKNADFADAAGNKTEEDFR